MGIGIDKVTPGVDLVGRLSWGMHAPGTAHRNLATTWGTGRKEKDAGRRPQLACRVWACPAIRKAGGEVLPPDLAPGS
jgi:hypothetical protein